MKKIIIFLLSLFILYSSNPTILNYLNRTLDTISFSSKENRIIQVVPVTGRSFKSFTIVDDTIVNFMKLHQIPAATVAIMKDGHIVFSHGYGYSDYEQSVPTNPNTLMRIASITKPFTAAAIRNLIQAGKLKLNSRIMDIIDISPFKGKVVDSRWYDITVENLLMHKGGWNRNIDNIEYDPAFLSLDIQREMNLEKPPDSRMVISYMMSKSLDFKPGEKYAYSNFGYSILGRVIEKVSGMSYFEYLKKSVLLPAEIDDMELGRTLPQDRSPKEIQYYYHPGKVKSVFNSNLVSPPDGGFFIEAMDSYGGLIASAPDLVKFAQKYWVNGCPRLEGQRGTGYHYGVLDGTYSYLWWRQDNINVAILLNQRIGDVDYIEGMTGEDINACYAQLKKLVDQSIDKAIGKRQ